MRYWEGDGPLYNKHPGYTQMVDACLILADQILSMIRQSGASAKVARAALCCADKAISIDDDISTGWEGYFDSSLRPRTKD